MTHWPYGTPLDAYCLGYGVAVKGGGRGRCRSDYSREMRRAWMEGFDDAIREGKFATHPDYCKRTPVYLD